MFSSQTEKVIYKIGSSIYHGALNDVVASLQRNLFLKGLQRSMERMEALE